MVTHRRLAALERHQHDGGPMVVVIRGGVTSSDPTYAQAGELQFARADGESFQAFEARAVADATAAGHRFVCQSAL
jgi:hypothetical protein